MGSMFNRSIPHPTRGTVSAMDVVGANHPGAKRFQSAITAPAAPPAAPQAPGPMTPRIPSMPASAEAAMRRAAQYRRRPIALGGSFSGVPEKLGG